jgi:hypothetical protein
LIRAVSRGALAAGLLTMACAGRVSAQPAARRERAQININAGAQISSISLDTSSRQAVYVEDAVVDTSYKYRYGSVFDGGISYTLAGGFGVGVAMSWFSQSTDAEISAAVPHPFFFQAPRTVSGTAAAVGRDTLAAHFQVIYTFRPAPRIEVAVGAGPSFFRVRQTIVDNVSFRDTYPYDAPTFVAASTQRVSGHKAGGSASADVSLRLSRHFGLGGMIRASKADIQLAAPARTTIAKSQAGGVHTGGGVRIYF